MMMLGFFWAAFAPLILLLPVWAGYRMLAPVFARIGIAQRLSPRRSMLLRVAAATLIVLLPVVLVWCQDRSAFLALCQTEGQTVIRRTAIADGFFLNDATANSFGMRYLQSEGFQWMEARSIYQRDEFTRYERTADGKVSETPQKAKTARYEVHTEYLQPMPHTSMTVTRVIDTHASAGEQEMARSVLAHFDGGRMYPVLGGYGTASFPDPSLQSDRWRAAYDVVRNTLGHAR